MRKLMLALIVCQLACAKSGALMVSSELEGKGVIRFRGPEGKEWAHGDMLTFCHSSYQVVDSRVNQDGTYLTFRCERE